MNSDQEESVSTECETQSDELDQSEMKSNFCIRKNPKQSALGIRRYRAIQKFVNEISNQIIEDDNRKVTVEKYCTEYDSNYHYKHCDDNKAKKQREELFLKYPLYSSEPYTFYKYTLNQNVRGEARLFGHIFSKRPFRRCAQFTKEQAGDCSY